MKDWQFYVLAGMQGEDFLLMPWSTLRAALASSEGQTSGGSRVTATDNRPKCVGEPNGSPCYYPPHDGDYCVYHHHRYSDQRAVQDATSGGPRADGEG